MEDKKMAGYILEQLQLRNGLSDSSIEGILEDMISDCLAELRDYLNYRESDEFPHTCASIIKELVLMKYNRDGAEGEQSESNSGVSVSYLTDLPSGLKRRIYRYRKLRR